MAKGVAYCEGANKADEQKILDYLAKGIYNDDFVTWVNAETPYYLRPKRNGRWQTANNGKLVDAPDRWTPGEYYTKKHPTKRMCMTGRGDQLGNVPKCKTKVGGRSEYCANCYRKRRNTIRRGS
jgi:hypothetical protein